MARIGDETPLARERGLEPVEHLVQGLAEPRDLVVRRRHGQPLARRRRGDLGGAPAHRLDRAKGGPGEQVACEGGQDEHDRASDEELAAKCLERVVAILEAGAHDHDHLLVAGVDAPRQESDHMFEVRHGDPIDEGRLVTGRVELVLGQQVQVRDERSAVDHGALAVEHLREVLFGLHEPPGRAFGQRVAHALGPDEGRDVVHAGAQSLIQDLVQLAVEPDVEERRQAGEHERHGEREGEAQA